MSQEYQKLIETKIFPGYARITYAKPLTGYSGESTVQICWLFGRGAEKPERTVVVKFDKPEKLEREDNNYNRYIKDRIHRPSFFVEPTKLWPNDDNPRALLYQYAGELAPEGAEIVTFDKYCEAHLAADVASIKAILDKTFEYLKELYNLAPQTVQRVRYDELYSQLGDPSIEERMKRSPKKLYDIPLSERFTDIRAALCELLQERVDADSFDVDGFNLLNPLTHIEQVLGDESEPELHLRCGVVFGDLNLRNLLIIGGNPCLIDYECMTDKEHLARDFVHLEMDWLLHVLTPYLQDKYPDEWRRTYLTFASGIYAVTQAGLNEIDIEHDAPAYTPPEDDFLRNGFILLGHLRNWAREFTYERGYRRSYKSRDYMAALYAESLGCLRHENLDGSQRWTALMTSSIALAYLLDKPPGGENMFGQRLGVSGSSEKDLEERVKKLCLCLGKEISKKGLSLINGGRNGVGKYVSKGAFDYLKGIQVSLQGRIISLVPRNKRPEHSFGEVHYMGKDRDERRRLMVQKADVFIFVSGRMGTEKEYEAARRFDTIAIPIGSSGGTAGVIWAEISDKLEEYYKEQISRTEFNRLNSMIEKPEAVARLAVDLAVRMIRYRKGEMQP